MKVKITTVSASSSGSSPSTPSSSGSSPSTPSSSSSGSSPSTPTSTSGVICVSGSFVFLASVLAMSALMHILF
ncbi:hypothetical protein Hanom_Chr06g00560471 [Helianthus anomalus]